MVSNNLGSACLDESVSNYNGYIIWAVTGTLANAYFWWLFREDGFIATDLADHYKFGYGGYEDGYLYYVDALFRSVTVLSILSSVLTPIALVGYFSIHLFRGWRSALMVAVLGAGYFFSAFGWMWLFRSVF